VSGNGLPTLDAGARHLQFMGDNPVFARAGMKLKRDHMDLVPATNEFNRELVRPMFEAATRGIEPLEHETDFQFEQETAANLTGRPQSCRVARRIP